MTTFIYTADLNFYICCTYTLGFDHLLPLMVGTSRYQKSAKSVPKFLTLYFCIELNERKEKHRQSYRPISREVNRLESMGLFPWLHLIPTTPPWLVSIDGTQVLCCPYITCYAHTDSLD